MNLDFTRIAAPITGKISRTLLTAGNLVNADTTLLTTIMSIDPMYAYFNVEEPTLLQVQKMKREGIIQQRLDARCDVQMGLADDVTAEFPLHGMLDFANNTVDPQTGTILVRGTFANPYELPDQPPVLMPGLFVRVRLDMGPPHKTLLVTRAGHRHRPGPEIRLRRRQGQQGRLSPRDAGTACSTVSRRSKRD